MKWIPIIGIIAFRETYSFSIENHKQFFWWFLYQEFLIVSVPMIILTLLR